MDLREQQTGRREQLTDWRRGAGRHSSLADAVGAPRATLRVAAERGALQSVRGAARQGWMRPMSMSGVSEWASARTFRASSVLSHTFQSSTPFTTWSSSR